MGGFRKGRFSNNRFVLKPDVAIATEVSIFSKDYLAITDFHVKKTQHIQLFEKPPSWNPPIRDSQTPTPQTLQNVETCLKAAENPPPSDPFAHPAALPLF